MNNGQGKFIAIYGMNNLGKSTQANALVSYLQKKGVKAKYLKYPIYDLEPTGPKINSYLREGQMKDWTPLQIQELYAQNRRDFEPTLKSLLEEGCNVVAEDYNGTGEAWGRILGADKEKLRALNLGLINPDLEILFDGDRFALGIEANHAHEGLPMEDWIRGRQIHLELCAELGWKCIAANGTREEVLERLVESVEDKLPFLERRRTAIERY